ncbi:T-cell surface glycoprotein CD3 delta chain-like isoform X2 [Dunckerocampus dactyliophorus]|uniref:T-cell surface glycoprotein CD3 delta chain-like isoform X2 n=1 Tax=Dunckerocampus dactyliophorus TaxID=161453 RepID=UPI002405B10E|nr:T-cell surface glycoprotein CD3 delta chain-like isoform X2 [Dunckerocampus dactyliophorus]
MLTVKLSLVGTQCLDWTSCCLPAGSNQTVSHRLQHNSHDTMKCSTAVSSLMVLWTLTETVWCIEVVHGSGEITIVCTGNNKIVSRNGEIVTFPLKVKDDKSGEYICTNAANPTQQETQETIFVKFRSCDNCVELDVVSIAGLAAGELMATIVLGVAVYLVASQAHAGVTSPQHKSKHTSLSSTFCF